MIFLCQLLSGGLDAVLITDGVFVPNVVFGSCFEEVLDVDNTGGFLFEAKLSRLGTITRSVLHYASDSSVPEVQNLHSLSLPKWSPSGVVSQSNLQTLPYP